MKVGFFTNLCRFGGSLNTHFGVDEKETLTLYNVIFFSFLGICTKSSRTSSENAEQGENSSLILGGEVGQDSM